METDPPKGSKPTSSSGRKFAANNWLSLGQLASTGTEMGLTIAALTLLGWWLDSKWNTSPWMLITGALIGSIGSMYKLFRVNKRFFDEKDDRKEER